MIYDCFLFNDELELLELRLMETYDLIDWFVLVEAPINWQLKPKRLYYSENKDMFSQWSDKIRHIIAEDLPHGKWPVTESAQRARMEEGCFDALPGDTIIVSDVDEIMSRFALRKIKNEPPMGSVVLLQHLYYYWVNCKQNVVWRGPVALPRRNATPVDGHKIIWTRGQPLSTIKNGGYHFSWMGDVARIQYKLRCHTVAEDSGGRILPPDANDVKHLRECVETGKDLFRRTEDYAQKRFVPINPGITHPKSIMTWLEKYPEYFHEE